MAEFGSRPKVGGRQTTVMTTLNTEDKIIQLTVGNIKKLVPIFSGRALPELVKDPLFLSHVRNLQELTAARESAVITHLLRLLESLIDTSEQVPIEDSATSIQSIDSIVITLHLIIHRLDHRCISRCADDAVVRALLAGTGYEHSSSGTAVGDEASRDALERAMVTPGCGDIEWKHILDLIVRVVAQYYRRDLGHPIGKVSSTPVLDCSILRKDLLGQRLSALSKILRRIVSSVAIMKDSLLLSRYLILTEAIQGGKAVSSIATYEFELFTLADLEQAAFGQILPSITSGILELPELAKEHAVKALQSTLWHWIQTHPREFSELHIHMKKFPGAPEILFDTTYALANTMERKWSVRPLHTVLLLLCPQALATYAIGKLTNRQVLANKKETFMAGFHRSFNDKQGDLADIGVLGFSILCQATAILPMDYSLALRIITDELRDVAHQAALVTKRSEIQAYYFESISLHLEEFAFLQMMKRKLSLDTPASRAEHFLMALQRINSRQLTRADSQFRCEFLSILLETLTTLSPIESPPSLVKIELHRASLIERIISILGQILVDHMSNLQLSERGDKLVAEALGAVVARLDTDKTEIRKEALRIVTAICLECKDNSVIPSCRQKKSQYVFYRHWTTTAVINTCRPYIRGDWMQDQTEILIQSLRAIYELRKSLWGLWHIPFSDLEIAQFVAASNVLALLVTSPSAESSVNALSCLYLPLADWEFFYDNKQISGTFTPLLPSKAKAIVETARPADVLSGKSAQQKRVRSMLRSSDGIISLMMWQTLLPRWRRLTKLLLIHHQYAGSSNFSQNSSLLSDMNISLDQAFSQWQNWTGYLLALSRPSGAARLKDPQVALAFVHFQKAVNIPSVNLATQAFEDFAQEIIDLFGTDSNLISQSIQTSTANEVHADLFPSLIAHLRARLDRNRESAGNQVDAMSAAFFDHTMVFLKDFLERLQEGEDHIPAGTGFGRLLAHIIQEISGSSSGLHQKLHVKFFHICECWVRKTALIHVLNEGELRRSVMRKILHLPVQSGSSVIGSISNYETSRLKALTALMEDLPLQEGRRVNQSLPEVLSYITRLYTVSAQRLDDSESRQSGLLDADPAISQALSTALRSSQDMGYQQLDQYGYHENIRLRTAFLSALANVIRCDGCLPCVELSTIDRLQQRLLNEITADNLDFTLYLCRACSANDHDLLAKTLMDIFVSRGNALRFVTAIIAQEFTITSAASDIFRQNSVETRIIGLFGQIYGAPYLRDLLGPIITELNGRGPSFSLEIDPMRCSNVEERESNLAALKHLTQTVLNAICNSGSQVPKILRLACREVRRQAGKKFPESKSTALASFFFLRFLCPALVAPEKMGLPPPANSHVRRALVLLAKIHQNLANNLLFGGKERFMIDLNDLVSDNIFRATEFLGVVSSLPPQNSPIGEPDPLFRATVGRSEIAVLQAICERTLGRRLLGAEYKVAQRKVSGSDPADEDWGEIRPIINALHQYQAEAAQSSIPELAENKEYGSDRAACVSALFNASFFNLAHESSHLRRASAQLIKAVADHTAVRINTPSLSDTIFGLVGNAQSLHEASSHHVAGQPSAEIYVTDFVEYAIQRFAKSALNEKIIVASYTRPWMATLARCVDRDPPDQNEIQRARLSVRRFLRLYLTDPEARLLFGTPNQLYSYSAACMDLFYDECFNASLRYRILSPEIHHLAVSISNKPPALIFRSLASRARVILQTLRCDTQAADKDFSWHKMSLHCRFALVVAHSDVKEWLQELPEMLALLSLLVGMGPRTLCSCLWGIFTVMVHTAASNAKSDSSQIELKQMAFFLESESGRALFLISSTSSDAVDQASSATQTEISRLSLREIDLLYKRFLTYVIEEPEVLRTSLAQWRAYLMPFTAYEADDRFRQRSLAMLPLLTQARHIPSCRPNVLPDLLRSLAESHQLEVKSGITSLRVDLLERVVSGTPLRSDELAGVLWSALILMQVDNEESFDAALELYSAVYCRITKEFNAEGSPKSVMEYMNRRAPKRTPLLLEFEQLQGLRYDGCFSICSCLSLCRGASDAQNRQLVLSTLTRMLTNDRAPQNERPPITVPELFYLCTLMPLAARDGKELQILSVLRFSKDVTDFFASGSPGLLERVEIPDNSTGLILAAFLLSMLQSAETENEELCVYRLLAEIAICLPVVFNLISEAFAVLALKTLGRSRSPALNRVINSILVKAAANTKQPQSLKAFPTYDYSRTGLASKTSELFVYADGGGKPTTANVTVKQNSTGLASPVLVSKTGVAFPASKDDDASFSMGSETPPLWKILLTEELGLRLLTGNGIQSRLDPGYTATAKFAPEKRFSQVFQRETDGANIARLASLVIEEIAADWTWTQPETGVNKDVL